MNQRAVLTQALSVALFSYRTSYSKLDFPNIPSPWLRPAASTQAPIRLTSIGSENSIHVTWDKGRACGITPLLSPSASPNLHRYCIFLCKANCIFFVQGVSPLFEKHLFLCFVYGISTACVYVHGMQDWYPGSLEAGLDPLELELLRAGSPHVCAGPELWSSAGAWSTLLTLEPSLWPTLLCLKGGLVGRNWLLRDGQCSPHGIHACDYGQDTEPGLRCYPYLFNKG